MAKYIKQEVPDFHLDGEKKVYYRLKTTRKIGFQEFVEYMCAHNTGINKGEALRVLMRATDSLAELLAEGYSVNIDELGIFKATIGLVNDKEVETLDDTRPKRNARSLHLNGVNFQADKKLVMNAARRCQLKSDGVAKIRHSPFNKKERLNKVLVYLEENGMIRVKDYMELVGLSHTTAAEELNAFSRDASSGITSKGRLAGKIYVKAPKE